MKLELVSHPVCPFVHRSAILLAEKRVPHTIRYVEDLRHKPDWFVALSPRGKVPLLVVDGTVLFESSVINEFLDETVPPPWLPANPLEKARQRAWVEVANDMLALQFRYASAASPDVSAEARGELGDVFDRLGRELRGAFFAGRSLGLVDVAFAPAFHRFAVLERVTGDDVYAGHARVAEWARGLAARTSVVASAPADFASRFFVVCRERGSALLARAS